MDTLLKDKKINGVVFILLVIISLFFVVRTINEIKLNRDIGNANYSNVIYVNGSGEVKAIPDIASLSINISKEGVTAKEAQDLLNEKVSKAVEYFKSQKIEEKDIKSQYGGLNPKYSYEKVICYTYPCPPNEPKIVGYTATQSIVIKVREVDNANIIRTGLADLGITDISGPTFSIDDEEIYKAEALVLSIADAKAKAEVLAENLGVKLGKIISYSEYNEDNYPMYEKSMMLDSVSSRGVAIPTLPKGENIITSNVTITFEIR